MGSVSSAGGSQKTKTKIHPWDFHPNYQTEQGC